MNIDPAKIKAAHKARWEAPKPVEATGAQPK